MALADWMKTGGHQTRAYLPRLIDDMPYVLADFAWSEGNLA
jgi:hypothetical protein